MSSATIRTGSGSSSTWAAFLVGVPVGVGLVWALTVGPLHSEKTERYLHHPVEKVELVMFCGALAALGAKLVSSFREKAALRAEILPAWDGRAVPASNAAALLKTHEDSLDGWSGTWLGRRFLSVLQFVKGRGTANELDDQIRTLADNDIMSQEASYALVRFITWAIPILGFLGTVLGITDAITGVTPEKMEHDMSSVTSGLSLAFDATALGLGLTMVLMFVNFLVERIEQGVLEQVDATVEAELGHRFTRTGAADQAPLLSVIEEGNQRLYDTTEGLVRRQSDLWSQSLERIAVVGRESVIQQHKQLVVSLEHALQGTLTKHAQRLAESETQMLARQDKMLTAMAQLATGLTEVSQRVAQQTSALAQLQHSGGELSRLQESLAQNLSALAGAGAFEEAVQALTAAIHLLTTRTTPVMPRKVA